jgi:hypothetical protein
MFGAPDRHAPGMARASPAQPTATTAVISAPHPQASAFPLIQQHNPSLEPLPTGSIPATRRLFCNAALAACRRLGLGSLLPSQVQRA